MQNSLFVTQQESDMFKTYYNTWKSNNFPEGDSEILPLLELFSPIAGLAPVFSCSGHEPSYKETSLKNFSIQFAATAEGFAVLQNIYIQARTAVEINAGILRQNGANSYLDNEVLLPSNISLAFSSRHYPWKTKDSDMYSTVILSADQTFRFDLREYWINLLLKYVKENSYRAHGKQQTLKRHLATLDIPIRTINALSDYGIFTVGNLVAHSRSTLRMVSNLGVKGMDVLEAQLAKLDLKLKP